MATSPTLRWSIGWDDLWLIVLKSSGDYPWQWANAGDKAEEVFEAIFPSVHAHLETLKDALVKRLDKGRYWWELRSCAYWREFGGSKIV